MKKGFKIEYSSISLAAIKTLRKHEHVQLATLAGLGGVITIQSKLVISYLPSRFSYVLVMLLLKSCISIPYFVVVVYFFLVLFFLVEVFFVVEKVFLLNNNLIF